MMQRELDVAQHLAIEAGAMLLDYYTRPPTVEWKGEHDPVTAADRAVSAFLTQELDRHFPGDAVMSEEDDEGARRTDAARLWIVDPLDGTREFVDRLGEFAVMIGLTVERAARLGVVYQPTTGLLYAATTGGGAWVTEGGVARRLHVDPESRASELVMAVSRSHHGPEIDAICERLGVTKSIVSGSLGLKVALMCEGRAHLYVHAGSRVCQWDTCAPNVILSEAGGRMTDLAGEPLAYGGTERRHPRGVVATNGAVHDLVLAAAQGG